MKSIFIVLSLTFITIVGILSKGSDEKLNNCKVEKFNSVTKKICFTKNDRKLEVSSINLSN